MRRIISIAAYMLILNAVMLAEGKPPLDALATNAVKDVGDLTAPRSLWRSSAFVAIAANSVRFEAEAVAMVGSNDASEEKKQVIIYAMQTLPKMDYLQFFVQIANLYERGKCSDMVMALTLDPGFEWGCAVVQNYKSDIVDSKLQGILSNTRASRTIKNAVNEITTGRRYTRMLTYLESDDDRGSDALRLPMKLWAEEKIK